MAKGTTIGLALLAIGILIWILYGLYLGFDEIMQAFDLVTGFTAGLSVVGFIILFGSIIIEQRKGTKKMKETINKEDLKP